MRLPPGGRERNFQGLRAPGPLYGAYPARTRGLVGGGSAPGPRAHFWTPKSGRKNRWGDPSPPPFVQSVSIRLR